MWSGDKQSEVKAKWIPGIESSRPAGRSGRASPSALMSSPSLLEQVVAGTAPPDYSDPAQFFSRTYFTRALKEHSGMVLRRLSGRDGEYRAGPDAGHPVRRGQDPYVDLPLPPRQRWPRRFPIPRRVPDLLSNAGVAQASSRPSWRFRRQRLGSCGRDGRRPGSIIARQLAGDKGRRRARLLPLKRRRREPRRCRGFSPQRKPRFFCCSTRF